MSIDISDLLPDPNKENYDKIKAKHPYNILLTYANAIESKYPGKLAGIVTESKDMTNNKILSYAFYITAAIGTGYSYRLLELDSIAGDMYPLDVKIFEKHTQSLDNVGTPLELENALQSIFSSGFTHTLILNLLAQIDLYNESRNE